MRYRRRMREYPRLVSSQTVYHGKLFDVELDELEMPGGGIARREIIRHPGAVCMVPIDADGRIVLVTQYRHAAGKRLLELPAGTLEPGEEPETTAVRELQEEIGMRPGKIASLGGFFVAPGYTSEYIWLYVCTSLVPARLDADDDEDIEVEYVTTDQALAAIKSGGICDGKSVAGILRWLQSINQ